MNTTRTLLLETSSPRQRVAQSNIQETAMSPSKRISIKHSSAKLETTNLNILPSSEDKSWSTEAIPWSSLPDKLLSPGKVHYNFISPLNDQCYHKTYMQFVDLVSVIKLEFHLSNLCNKGFHQILLK